MTNIQTNIGDLKNQLKQLQEVNLAQIDRIQGLLEKISNPSFEKLSYREQYGAWDDEQLKDHEENKQRVLWLWATDCAENPDDYDYLHLGT